MRIHCHVENYDSRCRHDQRESLGVRCNHPVVPRGLYPRAEMLVLQDPTTGTSYEVFEKAQTATNKKVVVNMTDSTTPIIPSLTRAQPNVR